MQLHLYTIIAVFALGACGAQDSGQTDTAISSLPTNSAETPGSLNTDPAELSEPAEDVLRAFNDAVSTAEASNDGMEDMSFADELAYRVEVEQAARYATDLIGLAELSKEDHLLVRREIWGKITALDADNTEWLKAHLPEDGWFRISRDGAEVSSNAWMIVQHSPDDAWRKDILDRMTPLLKKNEVSGQSYALLYDRVQMFDGKPQRYGSQGTCKDGVLVLHELENPENVDALRAQIGLSPLEDYVKLLNIGAPC